MFFFGARVWRNYNLQIPLARLCFRGDKLFGKALENSTSHIFSPFKFIFSIVGSRVLLSVKQI